MYLQKPPYANENMRLDKVLARKAEEGVKVYPGEHSEYIDPQYRQMATLANHGKWIPWVLTAVGVVN